MEPETIRNLDAFINAEGFLPRPGGPRHHHGIHLSDSRKMALEKMKTAIRHPWTENFAHRNSPPRETRADYLARFDQLIVKIDQLEK